MAKSQEVSSETAFSEPTRSAGSGTWSLKFHARRSRLDAGPNSPQARASSTFNRGKRRRDWSSPAIHLAIQCGQDVVHGLRSTISISYQRSFVEGMSVGDGAGGVCATGTLQLSSEQRYNDDVRYRYPSIKTSGMAFAWEAWYLLPIVLVLLACSLSQSEPRRSRARFPDEYATRCRAVSRA